MNNTSISNVKFSPNLFSIVNFIGQKGHPAAEKAGTASEFGDILARHGPKGHPEAMMSNAAPPPGRSVNETGKTAENQGGRKLDGQVNGNGRKPGDHAVGQANEKQGRAEGAAVTKAAAKLAGDIAAILGISPEDVAQALAALGLVPESLLESASLSDLAATLTAGDPLMMIVDEDIYNVYSDIIAAGRMAAEELLAETGLSSAELAALLARMAEDEGDGVTTPVLPDGALTESVNVTNETAAAALAQPDGTITIVIEEAGQVTHITAKTDELGNAGLVSEVVVTETGQDAAMKTQNGLPGQSAGEQRSDAKGKGQTLLTGGLDLSRLNSVEARFEPITITVPDTEMIMRQIMDFMRIQLSPETSRLEMQLHPAHLGTVGVRIASTGGVVTAQFVAQNETVRAAIESQIIELRDNMRQQGIRVESIEVTLESRAFDSALWQGNDGDTKEDGNRKASRRAMDLSGIEEGGLPEDLTADERIHAEMMIEDGRTVDYSA